MNKWCFNQEEDGGGIFCTAHLHEDRVFNYSYENIDEMKEDKFLCSDYRGLEGGV